MSILYYLLTWLALSVACALIIGPLLRNASEGDEQ
jgi:cytochrome oxidase assembly protein ShyY1